MENSQISEGAAHSDIQIGARNKRTKGSLIESFEVIFLKALFQCNNDTFLHIDL